MCPQKTFALSSEINKSSPQSRENIPLNIKKCALQNKSLNE
jgi:hypothetical protein